MKIAVANKHSDETNLKEFANLCFSHPTWGNPRLPYLDAMLNEVLRVASLAASGVPHAAVHDTYLDNYFIPKVRKPLSRQQDEGFVKE